MVLATGFNRALIMISGIFISSFALADSVSSPTIPEQAINVAKPIKAEAVLPAFAQVHQPINAQIISAEKLRQDPNLVQRLLNLAIEKNQIQIVKKLVEIYRTFPQKDDILIKFADAKIAKSEEAYAKAITLYREILAENPELNPVRIELATTLFYAQQDNAAREQFEKALTANDVPADIQQFIHVYLHALAKRDEWKFNLGASYLNESNVNGVSNSPVITANSTSSWTKGDSLLPQKATGIGYNMTLSRDFNLTGSHYVRFNNELWGKNYWDNHKYDDIINRTYLGYAYKNAHMQGSLLPFYEREWYGNHRYKWAQGVRGEINYWLTSNWQLSTALEWSALHYFQSQDLNGSNKLASATLVWARTPRQFFFVGGDFSAERTQVRHYSYDLKTLRLGWGQEWNWGVSTRLVAAISKRDYKDTHKLGRLTLFNTYRQDDIYRLNLNLWKRDWHILGITPKLNFNWKKQESNLDSLYSYIDRSINIVFEKSF